MKKNWGFFLGGMGLSPKTGCNLSSEATSNSFFFDRFFLVVCVRYFEHSFRLVADLNGEKTSIEEFSPIFFPFFCFLLVLMTDVSLFSPLI